MNLSIDNFDQVIAEVGGVVLVYFNAGWCGPCVAMSPIVDEVDEDMENVTVLMVDVDEEQDLAVQYNVLSIPTFVIFKAAQVVDQFSGSVSKEALKTKLNKFL